jgi:hypothetical protein
VDTTVRTARRCVTQPGLSMHTKPRIDTDVAAGLLFALLGAGFGAASLFGLKIGNPFRMGPGFFPAIVGGLLLLVGLLVAFNGLRAKGERPQWGDVPWRAVITIPTGLLLFGFAMRPLGLLPALLILSLLAAFAVKGMSVVRAVILAVSMTALCIGIFSFALGINLPLIGDWLR